MKVKDLLNKAATLLPCREAEWLLGALFQKSFSEIWLQQIELSDYQVDAFLKAVQRRKSGEPLQYICGRVEFFGGTFRVTPDVLIPRPETELFVSKMALRLQGRELRGAELWDMGTGSGCIGIALKRRFPELHVVLIDLCPRALAVAGENAVLNGVEVELRQGDLFEPLRGRRVHYLLSNPPYVTEEEYLSLDSEVRQEPRGALVGGEDGLAIYKRIAKAWGEVLLPGGLLGLELGKGQADSVKALFGGQGETERDLSSVERFFFLENH